MTDTGFRKAYDLKIMIKVKCKHVCVTMIDSLLKLRTSAKLPLNPRLRCYKGFNPAYDLPYYL